jgi:hypothetical protein
MLFRALENLVLYLNFEFLEQTLFSYEPTTTPNLLQIETELFKEFWETNLTDQRSVETDSLVHCAQKL